LGIRKALGAGDDALVAGVMGSAVITGALGVGLGLVGSFWLRPLLAAFLFGVEPFDPVTYGGIGILFLLICMVSSYLPARRLLSVDPVMVLREE
jgi:putative ABC transport system permease protein